MPIDAADRRVHRGRLVASEDGLAVTDERGSAHQVRVEHVGAAGRARGEGQEYGALVVREPPAPVLDALGGPPPVVLVFPLLVAWAFRRYARSGTAVLWGPRSRAVSANAGSR